jgi:hypothetical protein
MMPLEDSCLVIALLLMPLGALRAADAPPATPSIVLILADDLGVGDAQCCFKDGKIPTRNLVRLASQGMAFSVPVLLLKLLDKMVRRSHVHAAEVSMDGPETWFLNSYQFSGCHQGQIP